MKTFKELADEMAAAMAEYDKAIHIEDRRKARERVLSIMKEVEKTIENVPLKRS